MKTMLDNSNHIYHGTVPEEWRKRVTLYHGTTPENAASILMNGFDLDAKKRHDAGDFGDGVYLTWDRTRARHMGGPAILEVVVDLHQFAYIPNPYFLSRGEHIPPHGPIQEKFYCLAFDDAGEMATIHGDKKRGVTREQVCKAIREQFLTQGFHGIHTEYHGKETVVFNLNAIKKISWVRG